MSVQNRYCYVTDKKNITHLIVYVHQIIARCCGHELVQDQPYAGTQVRQTGCQIILEHWWLIQLISATTCFDHLAHLPTRDLIDFSYCESCKMYAISSYNCWLIKDISYRIYRCVCDYILTLTCLPAVTLQLVIKLWEKYRFYAIHQFVVLQYGKDCLYKRCVLFRGTKHNFI